MDLSMSQARRLVLAAQGFGRRPRNPTTDDVLEIASKIHCFRMDSVNVLVRAHHLPAFSRLGCHPPDAVDTLAYERRDLFEVAGRGVCLMPVAMFPLLRPRMDAVRSAGAWSEHGAPGADFIAKVYEEVVLRGPMTLRELSAPGKAIRSRWWSGNVGKIALEHLLHAGMIAVAERRGFERVYDVAERVIPRAVLDAPAPEREEAQKQLMCLAAKAQGVAVVRDLTDYFALPHQVAREAHEGKRPRPVRDRLVAELVEEGRLVRVDVESWREPGYTVPDAIVPRSVRVRALIGPFDTLMWSGMQRLCGFEQFLAQQLYVPANKRMFGYYVLPFLLGDTFVARCDLKTDRDRNVLMVQSAHLEPGEDEGLVAGELAAELLEMRSWLGLERIEVAERGDLAEQLQDALGT